jgi:hypothetical protein
MRIAGHHADDHPLAIDVAYLEAREFCASHAGAVEGHQQRASKQCPGCVDQARDFLAAQHRWQPAPVMGIGQEIAELLALESLHEKESQSRDLVDHRAGRQLAVPQQIGLIGSKFVGAELVGRLAKVLSEVGHNSQIITCGDGRVVATLKLLQHHFSQMGHRNTSCDPHLHQIVEQPTLHYVTRSVRRASGLVLVGNPSIKSVREGLPVIRPG